MVLGLLAANKPIRSDIFLRDIFAKETILFVFVVFVFVSFFRCSLIEPGPVATSFMSNLAEGDKPDRPPLDEETKQLFENCGKKMQAAFSTVVQSPEEIADEILRAVNEEKPHLRYQTNKNYATLTAAKLTDPTGDKPVELVYQNFFG